MRSYNCLPDDGCIQLINVTPASSDGLDIRVSWTTMDVSGIALIADVSLKDNGNSIQEKAILDYFKSIIG